MKPAGEEARRGPAPRAGQPPGAGSQPGGRRPGPVRLTRPGPVRLSRRGPVRLSRPGPVRLTRRGRVVLTAFLVCLALLAVGLSAAARAQAASSGASPAAVDSSMTRMVVQPGQTLWSIAVTAAPAEDPRAVIQQIMDVNALRGTTLQPGQQLWVPKG